MDFVGNSESLIITLGDFFQTTIGMGGLFVIAKCPQDERWRRWGTFSKGVLQI